MLIGSSHCALTHRYCNEIARHTLEILQLATLAPAGRCHLLEAFPEPSAAGHTNGIPVLLDVAHGVAYSNDPEVTQNMLLSLFVRSVVSMLARHCGKCYLLSQAGS